MLRAFFIAGFALIHCACTNSSGKNIAVDNDSALHTAAGSKVLIELFTSQGCSSCPAADKLIGNIISTDTNIISLSFHVDYWDRLGWKDVFSSHDYTVRQQDYVRALHAESLYTPQAVVQGKYEMVGSNRTRLLDAVNKTKAQTTNQTITAATVVNGNNIKINYTIAATKPKQQVAIVLAQNKATTAVGKGENAGAQLADYNVVRNFIIQPAHDSGSLELTLPADLQKENASVIIFTQDEETKVINAVTQVYL